MQFAQVLSIFAEQTRISQGLRERRVDELRLPRQIPNIHPVGCIQRRVEYHALVGGRHQIQRHQTHVYGQFTVLAIDIPIQIAVVGESLYGADQLDQRSRVPIQLLACLLGIGREVPAEGDEVPSMCRQP